jgi:hypothetical protein
MNDTLREHGSQVPKDQIYHQQVRRQQSGAESLSLKERTKI